MTPEEFLVKLEELRTIVSDKLAELEEAPKSGPARTSAEQIVNALDELAVQVDALSEALQEEPDEDEGEEGES